MIDLSETEIDSVSGGLEWWQRVAIGALPGGGIYLAAYDLRQSYEAGYEGAHGRKNSE